jgi:hypothetical protein
MEKWMPIEGYEQFYEVSSEGRVRSLDRSFTVNDKRWGNYIATSKGRILKSSLSGKGPYKKVVLTKGSEFPKETKLVHRLVAQAFIPNPDNKPVAHHINHDKLCNKVENLEWATSKENSQAANNFGILLLTNKKIRKFSEKQLEWMKSLTNAGYTAYNLAEIFGTGVGFIRTQCGLEAPNRKQARLKWCYPNSMKIFRIQNTL